MSIKSILKEIWEKLILPFLEWRGFVGEALDFPTRKKVKLKGPEQVVKELEKDD